METYQEINTKYGVMRGMLHRTEDDKKVPLVIMFHGFTGNRIDSKFIFVSFSRFLAKHGIASLRFDFIGSGESDGVFHEMTFLREVEQANLIVEYAKGLTGFSKIILMGFSMGGAITSYIGSDHIHNLEGLLLWSPAGNMDLLARSYFTNYPSLENGNIDLDGIELSRTFYEELQGINLYQNCHAFTKPVCVLHGSHDQAVPIEYGLTYSERFPNATFFGINQADHIYSSLEFRKILFNHSLNFINHL
jgi:uncharacterized protein